LLIYFTCIASLADAQKRQGVKAGRLVDGLVPAADMPLTLSQLDVSLAPVCSILATAKPKST
jgi:hypothetical protein